MHVRLAHQPVKSGTGAGARWRPAASLNYTEGVRSRERRPFSSSPGRELSMAPSWPVVSLKQGFRRRWDRLWRGECDPETLRSVPSWGMSVILHALMILILAIIIGGHTGQMVRRRRLLAP